ncbi:MAG: GntR family transcriptional regulator [Steroidobacteraceae bacterium]
MDGQPGLEARNLPDQLANELVIMIATGELKPGQRVFEKRICELKGISRIPVREALRLLQAQGVVRTEPNRGTYVTEFTSDEMLEMLELRLTVERIALRRIIEQKTPKALITSRLSVAIEAIRRAAELRDPLALCQADLWFHDCIIDLAASPVLVPTWQLLSRGVMVFLMRLQAETSDELAAWITDHEEILAALQSDATTTLHEFIERHIFSVVRERRAEIDRIARGSSS